MSVRAPVKNHPAKHELEKMRLLETFLYGRRVLVAFAALLSFGIQVACKGQVFATLVCVSVQIAALGVGGAPGSFAWFFFSRQRAAFPDRREWNGAMHCFITVTIAMSLSVGSMLSSQFLGCSGAFLLLSYSAAKLGCYRLGCCAWSLDQGMTLVFRKLSRRIELQTLEAALSFAGGAVVVADSLFALDSTRLFLSAVAIHLGLRQLFDAVRSSRRTASELPLTDLSGGQNRIGITDPDTN